jgi:hypothetical protein
MKELFEEQMHFANAQHYIIIRYIVVCCCIIVYPLCHFLTALWANSATPIRFNDQFLFHASIACGVGLSFFLGTQIKSLVILYIDYRQEMQQERKNKIIKDYQATQTKES